MDVSNYWKIRGKEYFTQYKKGNRYWRSRLGDQEKELIKILKQISFNNILEIGCGFGRITKIISSNFNFEKYVAIDISQDQLDNAKKYVNNPNIDFECKKIQDFDIGEKFDLVIVSEILMHINFEDINPIMKKITNLSNNQIISIDWNDKDRIGESAGGYCFMHDYKKMYKNNNVKQIKTYDIPFSNFSNLLKMWLKIKGKTIANQSIFLVKI